MDFFNEEHFTKHKVKLYSPEWFDFRTIGYDKYGGGIGASEVSKLFYGDDGTPINPYRPIAAELYYHKIGAEIPSEFANENTYWGVKDERQILNSWQFYDGEEGSYVANEAKWVKSGGDPETYTGGNEKLIYRRYAPCGYYLVNEKYPWLFISLDGAIAPGGVNLITGEMLAKPAPLEAKTIGHFTAKEYESGVPTMYIIQLHQQMLVTESDYGEIVLKKDGQKLIVKPFERNEALCQQILEVTHSFWHDRVLPGRIAWREAKMADMKKRSNDVDKFYGIVQELEPPSDNSEAYGQWKNERNPRIREYEMGKPSELLMLQHYKTVSEYCKSLEKIKQYHKNTLLNALDKRGTKEIVFDKGSYVRLSKHGQGERMSAGHSGDIDRELLQTNISKLNLNLF